MTIISVVVLMAATSLSRLSIVVYPNRICCVNVKIKTFLSAEGV
jgi:hypothetical protein